MIGIDPADADLFVPWVEDFFRGFGGDPDGLEAMAKALDGIREYWVAALAERRERRRPRVTATSPRICSTRRSTTARSPTPSCSTC